MVLLKLDRGLKDNELDLQIFLCVSVNQLTNRIIVFFSGRSPDPASFDADLIMRRFRCYICLFSLFGIARLRVNRLRIQSASKGLRLLGLNLLPVMYLQFFDDEFYCRSVSIKSKISERHVQTR